jgi:long-subunit fatty acid transport protein
MKKWLSVWFLIVIFPALAFNQQDQTANDPDQLDSVSVGNNATEKEPSFKDRFDTDFQAGTSFNYSPGNFYGPSYYIEPGVSYMVSSRFMLNAGIGFEYSALHPLYQQTESDKMLPMTRAYMYTRGSYFLTPRLTVNGTVYKSMMDEPRLTEYSGPGKYNYQGMSVGFQYKFSKSFSFGFEMHMQNGQYRTNGLIPASGYVPVPGF